MLKVQILYLYFWLPNSLTLNYSNWNMIIL
jgi:hypothetical protein